MFGRKPKADWLHLHVEGYESQPTTGTARVWHTPDGDGVGAYFFALTPDLPRSSDEAEFFRSYRNFVADQGIHLVEVDICKLADYAAVRVIVKIPQQPSGVAYVGSFTIPFESCSFVVKIQCFEHGVTGLREAVVLDKKLAANATHVDPASGTVVEDWDPDNVEFDGLFPQHPLSRTRRELKKIAAGISLDNAASSLKSFPLPAPRTV